MAIEIRNQTEVEDSPLESRQMYNFMHFETNEKCEVYLLNNPHISVVYKCCGGRGYAELSKKNNPSPHCPKKPTKPQETSIGTCDICFNENCSLYSICTHCIQPFCMNCLKKLPTKSCPNCRSELRVF